MDSTLLLSLVSLILLVAVLHARTSTKLRYLPHAGHTYIASVKNFFSANEGIRGGFGDRLFNFPILGDNVVVGKSRDSLSMEATSEELIQFNHVVGPPLTHEVDHFLAVKMMLNKNLGAIVAPLLDEMVDASWSTFSTILASVCNRVFVGEALSRNKEYIDLMAGLSDSAIRNGVIFRTIVPVCFRRPAGRLLQWILGHRRKMEEFLEPLIEERRRRRKLNEPLKNDMLSWMMGDENPSIAALAMAVININFLALHTTIKTFTNVFFRLASESSYVLPLREEIEMHLDPNNMASWSIAALSRCVKLDSFFKESMRLDTLGALWLPRMTLDEFTFSDGTTLPAKTVVAVAVSVVHENEHAYEDGRTFDGFRFSKKVVLEEEDSRWMHRMTTPSPSYLAFGKGQHLCPGRFFASVVMKFLTAYVCMNYDVKMEMEGKRPGLTALGPSAGPPRKTRILFRRRRL
ncbi:cytochrome P450 [Hymenopellis radicata]|nr:cytochrome P450 [Hymenopellis radicata]